GGSANMVAVQDILQAPENIFGYALITDTLVYSVWLMAMFSSVAVSDRFSRFTKARTAYLDTSDFGDLEDEKLPITGTSLAVVLFCSVLVSILAIWVSEGLPEYGQAVDSTTWTILIVSVLGLIAAHTPLGRVAGSTEIATLMLFLVIGQIAAGSDFTAITQAPLYLLIGFLVLGIHGDHGDLREDLSHRAVLPGRGVHREHRRDRLRAGGGRCVQPSAGPGRCAVRPDRFLHGHLDRPGGRPGDVDAVSAALDPQHRSGVVAVRAHRHRAGLLRPFVTSTRRTEAVEYVVVEVELEGGAVGQGSAAETVAVTGEDAQSILTTL